MSECYDCGKVFRGDDDCPACNSQNVGVLEREEGEVEEEVDNPHFWEDYLSEERFPDAFE